jgi:hypothetical protein
MKENSANEKIKAAITDAVVELDNTLIKDYIWWE